MLTPLPRQSPVALLSATVLALMGAQAAAQAPADFKGETISIEIGYGAGGGYDTYGRILARHYGRLIPGNPNVVAKNMPGAGSLRAANFIYNLAPKDGSELGIFAASTAMEPLMGNEQAKFDATRFSWIGSMNQDISFCGLWQGPGAATSFADLLKSDSKDAIFGSSGTAAISHQHPLILRDVEAGRLKLVIQMGPKTTDEFGKVPSAFDYVKSDEDRKVLEIHFKQTILGRPLAGPPGMPKERLAALRKALVDTMKDREFLAEAQRANLDVDPASAEQVEELLKQFADYPKAVVEKARAAIGR